MMRKSPLTMVTIILVLFCFNAAFGFDPLGPPKALLDRGEPSLGLDYIYNKMEIKTGEPFGLSDIDVSDVEMHKTYANLGYGFNDRWDVFARLGVAILDVDRDENIDTAGSMIGHSDPSLAIGAGTRVTFFQWEEISLGMLAQISFVPFENVEGHSSLYGAPGTMNSKINMTEIQIAIGPTWNCTEYLSVYGGPFLHLIDGTLDLDFTFDDDTEDYPDSVGIEQSSILGGYIGASVRFSEHPDIIFNVEFQTTGRGHAMAAQLAISP